LDRLLPRETRLQNRKSAFLHAAEVLHAGNQFLSALNLRAQNMILGPHGGGALTGFN
jgi:hypothetical protein